MAPHPHATVGQHKIEMVAAIEPFGPRAIDAEMKARILFVEQNIGGDKFGNAVVGADSDFSHFVAVRFPDEFPEQVASQAMAQSRPSPPILIAYLQSSKHR